MAGAMAAASAWGASTCSTKAKRDAQPQVKKKRKKEISKIQSKGLSLDSTHTHCTFDLPCFLSSHLLDQHLGPPAIQWSVHR